VLGAYKLASGAGATLAGFMLVIAAAFAWGVGNVIAKRAGADHDVDAFSLVVWSSLVPPLPLAAASYLFEGGADAWRAVASASTLTWACVGFLSWGATLFAFGAWNRLLHTYPTPLISPFALLVPVSGLASAAILLGERLAPVQAAGVALVWRLAVNVLDRWRSASVGKPDTGSSAAGRTCGESRFGPSTRFPGLGFHATIRAVDRASAPKGAQQ
jgi:O-acetylserine/cysteine efflux transporter